MKRGSRKTIIFNGISLVPDIRMAVTTMPNALFALSHGLV